MEARQTMPTHPEKGNQMMDKAGQEAQSGQDSAQQECLNEEFVRVGPKPKFALVAGYHRFDADGYVRLDQALADDAPFDICSCYTIKFCLQIRVNIDTFPEYKDHPTWQFSMHYACSTETRAHTTLANVSSLLRAGGIFIGTMPCDSERLRTADGLALGNSVYRIQFDDEFPEEASSQSN
ncbi:mRNA cap guanine-N7 methyltransferase 1 [Tanacetum coccineum]